MRFRKKYALWGVVLFLAMAFTACMLPEKKEDPFQTLPEEKISTLSGEIFPFSVSVPTSATHRLEKEGKLVAYLASKVVPLKNFENHTVEVDGVWRQEEMREIFLVEAIRLKEDTGASSSGTSADQEQNLEKRFLAKEFTFVYPQTWEYSLSPNGTAQFIDKNDSMRLVFFLFSVEDIQKTTEEPNIIVGDMKGIKKVTTDPSGKERQEIILFSHSGDRQYRFIFTSSPSEFDRKKAFYTLLNTFTDGEQNVQKVLDDLKKKLADEEAQKLQTSEAAKIKAIEDKMNIPGILEPSQMPSPESKLSTTAALTTAAPVLTEPVPSSDTSKETNATETPIQKETSTDKLLVYSNDQYGLTINIPWGHWYRSFGGNSVVKLGIANHDFSAATDAQVWVELIKGETVPESLTEKSENGQTTIDVPLKDGMLVRVSGPDSFRDFMMSVAGSVK